MKPALKPELKMGGTPKQYAILGVLAVVLIGTWMYNSTPSPGPETAARPATATPDPTLKSMPPAPGIKTPVRQANRIARTTAGGPRSANQRMSTQEFHPTLHPKDPIDTSKVDPTLHLTTLAKLRDLKVTGGARSLFDFSGAAAPAEGPVVVAKVEKIRPKVDGVLTTGPQKPQPPQPPPPPPPPPAIPLKFYGYTNAQQRQGNKRAFFIDGEDIFVAGEGDTIKNRYKVIRIGVNSAVIEDTQFKHQQTLPLIEELANS